jgi:hypothetical protein
MKTFFSLVLSLFTLFLVSDSYALSLSNTSRRSFLGWTTTAVVFSAANEPALAEADCFTDCFKNCRMIAPKDLSYCQENCKEYCDQTDRNDGLSGSVSSSGGEVGILGGTFGTGTVVKGEDKPPSIALPGLDFTKGTGKKLIGY